ncbi:4Fe-4S dicluster domain-containing protein [uncultured Mailhella sp.]|uniref:4Fe-4S dicluster domain-containing protein n=1 Tax=uncultured Mailhella sp. TaxID=1981031 RepID=UPI003209A56D
MPPKFSYEDTSAYLYIHPAMTLRRPPCQAACPAGTPISLMNKLLADDRKEEALAVLLDITPFPGSMCESCAKPCESACNKRQHTSKPVPIARLAQLAASCLPDANPPCGEPTGYTVAVIGTNVEALTMAYFLYRLGHTITVMGDASVDGGSGLPERGVKQYLADHGVAFCPETPEISTIECQYDIIMVENEAESIACQKVCVIPQKKNNTVAWVQEVRLAACEVDCRLHGCQLKDIAWIRILADGVERKRMPLDFPEDAKPVTTVHYEDLKNKTFYNDQLTFRDRLAPLDSLEEQAMECYHCGKCTGCGTCVNICPGDVLAMKDGKPYVKYPDECIHCSSCMLDCPSSAISFRLPLPATLGAPMKYLA